MKKISNYRMGFTLIEVLIVVSVMAVALPAVFGLFFINLQSQKKTYILQETKRNGDGALATMENLIRSHAVKIVDESDNELCATAGASESNLTEIRFKDVDDNTFIFSQNTADSESIKIASSSSTGINVPLTATTVSVTSLAFGCKRPSSFSSPIVSIAFTVTQAGNPGRSENEDSLTYGTQVKLRAYELSY